MILAFSLLCLIGLVLLFLFHAKHRLLIGTILAILILGSQTLLIADTGHHFGTRVRTQETTRPIYSVADIPGNAVLARKPVGSGKNRKQIYLYRLHTKQKDPSMTYSDKINVQIRTDTNRAKRVEIMQRYVYTNSTASWLFTGATNNGQVRRHIVRFELPDHWYVLDTNQLKRFAAHMKRNKSAMENAVKAQLTDYLRHHPDQAQNRRTVAAEQQKLIQNYVGGLLSQYAD